MDTPANENTTPEPSNVSSKPTTDYTEIEICVRASKNAYGLIDHFFMQIENFEYHPGYYKPGNILPKGTTKGLHVIEKRRVCQLCFAKLILDFKMYEDCRISAWYPILNCESLSTGISVQSVLLVAALPVILTLIVLGRFLYLVLFILFVLVTLLFYSKFLYSRCKQTHCRHLIEEAPHS